MTDASTLPTSTPSEPPYKYKSMTPDMYIKERIEDQCEEYYDPKAVHYKRWHLWSRRAAVVGAAMVPILSNWRFEPLGPVLNWPTTLVSLLVTILVALETVNRYGEQWKNYRSTYEFLKSEKFHFLTGEGVYRDLDRDPDKAFTLLVERCENRIATENSATLGIIETAAQHGDGSFIAHRPDVAEPLR